MKNELDDLLNSVFGRRETPSFDSAPLPELHAQPRAAKPAARGAQAARTPAARSGARAPASPARPVRPTPGAPAPAQPDADSAMHTVDELTQAVPQMSRELDERIARQREEIAQLNESAKADIERINRELRTPEVRALSRPGTEPPQPPRAGLSGFDGLEDALKEAVLGQDEFCRKLTIALKRPWVMGKTDSGTRGTIFLTGPEDSGRHLALCTAAKYLADRRVLRSPDIAWVDLALYPTPSEEKLFMQDLYMALAGEADLVACEHYEKCYPGFLGVLADLAQKGSHPLASRYVLQNGRLIDTGGALVKDAVRELSPGGRYLVLLSESGVDKLADSFGAGFVGAVSDVCAAQPLGPDALLAISGRECAALAERAARSLGFAVSASDAAKSLAAEAGGRAQRGASGVLAFWDKAYRALAQYKLEKDAGALTVSLGADGGHLTADFGAGAQDLLALLPQAWSGDVQAVKKELDGIVGLSLVKEYILSLEENCAVQKRRRAAGLRTSGVSMHMIFTGNPGTGKTTIARLVSRYLKAIGVLSGGQLVEVTRADLVGKYVGHTAPLTTQVLKSALGGVLFIDEAYSLYRGRDDSFGLECIDTLVKGMEDYRDDLVVILAGYTREMQEFLTANSGLKSRFPNLIEFPDYTGAELLQIARLQAQGKGYAIDARCDTPLLTYFNAVQLTRARDAGNGRLARNKVEEAILAQARRLANQPDADLCALLPEDFDLSDVSG